MEVAELAMRHLGRPVSQTSTRLAALTFYERLQKASEDWDEVTACLNDRVLPGGELDKDEAEDKLGPAPSKKRRAVDRVEKQQQRLTVFKGINIPFSDSEFVTSFSWASSISQSRLVMIFHDQNYH